MAIINLPRIERSIYLLETISIAQFPEDYFSDVNLFYDTIAIVIRGN